MGHSGSCRLVAVIALAASLALTGCDQSDAAQSENQQLTEARDEARLRSVEARLITAEDRIEVLERKVTEAGRLAERAPVADTSRVVMMIGTEASAQHYTTMSACEEAREAVLRQYDEQCRPPAVICNNPRVLCVPR